MVQLPLALYGTAAMVKKNAARLATDLLRGRPWPEVVGADRVEVDDRPGLVVLHGPSPLLGGAEHWQPWTLLDKVLERVRAGKAPPAVMGPLAEAALRDDAGLLSLISPTNSIWLVPEARQRPTLAALVAAWPRLDALGARYSLGATEGARLAELPTGLQFLLARLGASQQDLARVLPQDWIARWGHLGD